MKHDELQLLVSSYVDGEGTMKEKKSIVAHLKVCSKCRRFYEEAKKMQSDIRSLEHVELPYAFASRIAYAIEKRDEQTTEWLGLEPLARNIFYALAFVVLLMFVLTSSESGTSTVSTDQILSGMATDTGAAHVLLKQSELTRNDLLYVVLTK